ncbi:MAG: reverse transcriptase domain-containing protein, partial [Limisphaerales bacterium]
MSDHDKSDGAAVATDGAVYKGDNFIEVSKAIEIALKKVGCDRRQLAEPPAPESPFTNPGSYVLDRPDYTREPALGLIEHRLAAAAVLINGPVDQGDLAQFTAEDFAAARGLLTPATFTIEPANTVAGGSQRLSTTNTVEAVRKAYEKFQEAIEKFDKLNSKSLGIVLAHIDQANRVRLKVERFNTAAQVYAAIKADYDRYLRENADMLIERFRNIAPRPREDVKTYANRIRLSGEVVQQIGDGNHGSPADQVRLLFRGLQPKFEVEVKFLRTNNTPFEEAVVHLSLAEANKHDKPHLRPAQVDGDTSFKSGKAMAGHFRPGFGGRGGGSSARGKSAPPRFGKSTIKCYNCQRPGHFARNCPLPRRDDDLGGSGGSGGNGNSGGSSGTGSNGGHVIDRGGSGGANNGGGSNGAVPGRGGSGGRFSARGADRGGDGSGGGDNSIRGRVFAAHAIKTEDDDAGADSSSDEDEELDASGDFDFTAPKKSIVWHIDSQAVGGHMTPLRELFVDYRGTTGTVIGANGDPMEVVGEGSVKFWAQGHDGEWELVMLRNCLHVPKMRRGLNLISVEQITRDGRGVVFTEDGVSIVGLDSGVTEFHAPRQESVFTLQALVPVVRGPPARYAFSAHADGSAQKQFQLWHRKLGHLSQSGMRTIARNNLLDGVDTRGWTSMTLDFCEACVTAKLSHDKFRSRPREERATKPMERVHVDTAEMKAWSHVRSEYFSVLRDEATGYLGVIFARGKLWISEFLQEKIAQWQVKHERILQHLRLDGGTEFNDLKKWAASNGTMIEVSPPDTQELNGVAERAIRTLKETSLALRHDADFSEPWWQHAIAHGVYLRNITPYSGTDVTPYQAWHGRKPNVARLPVWGCDAWGLEPPRSKRRAASDSHTFKGVFVGFEEGTGHFLIAPRTFHGKARAFRTARFNESDVGAVTDAPSRVVKEKRALEKTPFKLTHRLVELSAADDDILPPDTPRPPSHTFDREPEDAAPVNDGNSDPSPEPYAWDPAWDSDSYWEGVSQVYRDMREILGDPGATGLSGSAGNPETAGWSRASGHGGGLREDDGGMSDRGEEDGADLERHNFGAGADDRLDRDRSPGDQGRDLGRREQRARAARQLGSQDWNQDRASGRLPSQGEEQDRHHRHAGRQLDAGVARRPDPAGGDIAVRRSARARAGRRLNPDASVLDEWRELRRQHDASRHPDETGWDGESGPVGRALAALGTSDFEEVDLDLAPDDEPTYRAAMAGRDREQWKAAAVDELLGVIESGTIEAARLPAGRSTIGSKFALKVKRDSQGRESKKKARLVAQGFTQVQGRDFHEVFAPVAKYSSVRLLTSLLADEDLHAAHTDVKLAYLNGDLPEELYMRPPADFMDLLERAAARTDVAREIAKRVERLWREAKEAEREGRSFYLRLRKPLYGLKQAGMEWNR